MPRRAFACVLIVVLTTGCSRALLRSLVAPESAATLDKRSRYLKAHMRDGRVYILSPWAVDEAARTVSGMGELRNADRGLMTKGSQVFSIDDVALFETNVSDMSSALAAMSVLTGMSVALTGYCIANPKACFGSCPTFYVPEGGEWKLRAEGFSSSVAPILEATDVDALPDSLGRERDIELRMRNEALETHVVRHVDLLAVPRGEGTVVQTGGGEMWRAAALQSPRACRAAEGDCLATLSVRDERERTSAADGRDLATRETVELDFGSRPDASALGVVVGARHTLLSTYLFYQQLSYMGRSATAWLARLERGEPGADIAAHGIGRALGRIEVLVQLSSGRWEKAGEVGEAGPLAADVQMVPLPSDVGSPVRVRLRLTKGQWRVDSVALATLAERALPLRLAPTEVRATNGKAPRASTPGALLTTLPGDEYAIRWHLPEHPERYELFLESRGYYLEWMRDEWLAEENPARAALMVTDPAKALRVLAPEFKKHEASMEDAFWGSRYAQH
jgi:hypothetical protein